MSQNSLILGGTSVLERLIQAALGTAPIVVGSVEEVTAQLEKHPDAVVILGPTFRRSLAAVGQIRPEGKTQPSIVVIFRDDQKDEVKRHQKGKAVADKYVQQSRASKDLEPALKSLGSAADVEEIEVIELIEDAVSDEDTVLIDDSGLELIEDDTEELITDDLEAIEDEEPLDATMQMDVVTLSVETLEDEPTTPMPGRATAHNEVLGELDVEELDGEEIVETLEPEAIELTEEGDDLDSLEEVLDGTLLEEETVVEEEAGTLDVGDLREETAQEHDAAVLVELQGLRDKLEIATGLVTEGEAQNTELQAKLVKQNAEIATLQEQLKAARGQVAALQTKMIDCRIQAEEAAGIVKALAGKLG